MKSQLTDRFIEALSKIERAGEESADVDSMVELFADDCRMSNLATNEPYEGKEGAHRFWSEYRASFKDIASRFNHREENGHCAVLEWVSEGSFKAGTPLSYRGVTILEHDGDRIHAFRSYYDSLALREDLKAA